MRQIVMDTETTGIDPAEGHRIIEIGGVEVMGRKITGQNVHMYINPERLVDPEAFAVHGISDEFLQDKPVFAEVVDEFIQFVTGAELLIHNAPFDVGFINHELNLLGHPCSDIRDICKVTDTLAMARSQYPGQRNSLDALCKRLGIDNSNRVLHGALLDSEILADVYLMMTGGQTSLTLGSHGDDAGIELAPIERSSMLHITVSADDADAHRQWVEKTAAKGDCQWQALNYQ
ncbi:MAG: DNA polymerase III subunit epsilon [Gammaproteobacteria bacterium]|nr:DNA polymerase III subunit epsilon [Gammaproteobacteria bacterium]